MKRKSAGSYQTYKQASKRQAYTPKQKKAYGTRKGYASVPRARGAAVSGEMKYYDAETTNVAIAAVTNTWVAGTMQDPETSVNLGDAAVATPGSLCVPKVSAALNGRIGRSIYVRKIKVRGHITLPNQAAQAVADPSSYCRLLLVQDCQTNASQMTAAALLNDASAADATINSFQNPNNFGRFHVLKDKTITIGDATGFNDAATTGTVSGIVRPFKFTVNFKTPVKVQFNATNGGTVADIVDNSWHIICGANTVTSAPLISYYSRVAYKE